MAVSILSFFSSQIFLFFVDEPSSLLILKAFESSTLGFFFRPLSDFVNEFAMLFPLSLYDRGFSPERFFAPGHSPTSSLQEGQPQNQLCFLFSSLTPATAPQFLTAKVFSGPSFHRRISLFSDPSPQHPKFFFFFFSSFLLGFVFLARYSPYRSRTFFPPFPY